MTHNERLRNALLKAGLTPQPYSGRDMGGRRCIAIKNKTLWEISQATVLSEVTIPAPSEDQLSRQKVFYWPTMAWNESWTNARRGAWLG